MKVTLFIIITAVFVYIADAQEFSINPPGKTIDITFDSPKGDRGWSNPYIREFEISVTNVLNTSLIVSVSCTSSDPSYIGLSCSKSSLNIPRRSSDSIKIAVRIMDSAADGVAYSGRVSFISNSQTEYANVFVKTIWPDPALSLSGNLDFGEVEAGKPYSGSFTLREQLKFKSAKDVKVDLKEVGPIYDVTASPSAFYEVDSYGKTITFSFKVKERGIVPGIYTPTISLSSTNNAYLTGSSLRYSIPPPILEVAQAQSEIIFNYSEMETRGQRFTISEKGGKTPLEDTEVSFNRLCRELGKEKKECINSVTWFSFPTRFDYISPRGSDTGEVLITPEKGVPIGRYNWEGIIKTKYAGEKPFQFYFVVIPPGMEDNKNNLIKFKSNPLVRNYPHAENLVKTTEFLMNKEEKAMADIVNVTSLTNVVIKFLNSMSAAYFQYGKNSFNEAYEEFRTGKEEIDELNNIKPEQIYSQERSDIRNSANNVWKELAVLLKNGLEQNATRLENPSYPDASYAEAKKVHGKIREICSWLRDISCVQEHNNRINDTDNTIIELISKASDLENNVSRIRNNTHQNTWSFSGTRLIKNPLKFPFFLENYIEMMENYNDISRDYRLSGEQREFENAQEKLAVLKEEYGNFRFINIMYVILLGCILILTIQKSIHGFIKYRADARDVRLAEIARLRRVSRNQG